MKFSFSLENSSGQCKLKFILRNSHHGGPGIQKRRDFCRFYWIGDRQAVLNFSLNVNEIWFQPRKHFGPVQVEVHFSKIACWGVQGSKNAECFAFFGKLEIGKLSWVYLSTNTNEIWFQHRKYLGPVQVEVHFAKNVFWGSKKAENLITSR